MAENDNGNGPLLKMWQCHKLVFAGKIIEVRDDGAAERALMVEGLDDAPVLICPGDDFYKRGVPKVGDYFVHYENDYLSWSPGDVFEAGYTLCSQVASEEHAG